MAYLTPNTLPADTICRVLFIPNDLEFVANVTGALQLLTFADSFVEQGLLTPQETADAYRPMFEAFCFNQGECRVIGEIIAFAGDTPPYANWFVCDGSSLLIADFPDLYDVIGITYGAPDFTHFNLPNFGGRSPSGVGSSAGVDPVTLGSYYGEQDHTLTLSEAPAHTHTDVGHTHLESTAIAAVGAAITGVPVPSAVPSTGLTGSGSAALDSAGGDGAHNNVGPRLAINFLIVAY